MRWGLGTAIVTVIASCAFAQPENWKAAHDELAAGVQTIAFPGSPGPIVVSGSRAFAVVAAAADGKGIKAPLVAAAELGSGRVVLFGHTSYLDAGTLGVGDSSALFLNCLKWAGRGTSPRIVVMGNAALRDALPKLGEEGSRPEVAELGKEGLASLRDIDVLCLGQAALKPEEVRAIRAFVEGGGGLIAAATGWGWLQLNPGRGLETHPLNAVLAGSGLVVADDTVQRVGEVAGQTRVEPWGNELERLNAEVALKLLEDPTTNPEVVKQAAWTATFAARSMVDRSNRYFERLEALTLSHDEQLIPKPDAPLKAASALDRVLVAYRCERDERSRPEEVRAHPAVEFFPGSVPADADIAKGVEIEVDMSVPKWHGTGLYVPAGRVVTIRLDAEAAKRGLIAQVGCHTDRLWELNAWKRVPDVVCRVALNKETVEIASAFGGLLYIDNPKRGKGTAEIVVDGAVRSPRFVLGTTTPEEWRKTVRQAPGPWAELESGKVVVTVPSSEIRTLEDPTAALKFWDAISDAHAKLGSKPTERDSPWRYVADVQISAGYMHSGYPIMTHLDAASDMVSVEQLRGGCWGLLHELGHNSQESDWTFDGTVEVTCNLFALHAIDTLCTTKDGSRGHGGVDKPPSVRKHIETGKDFQKWKADPFLALQFYIMLQDEFGWETFQKVFAEYQTLKKDERPRNDDEKRDQWMVRFSRACGKDLGPYFEAWGVPVSASAREAIAELPDWMPEGWPDQKK